VEQNLPPVPNTRVRLVGVDSVAGGHQVNVKGYVMRVAERCSVKLAYEDDGGQLSKFQDGKELYNSPDQSLYFERIIASDYDPTHWVVHVKNGAGTEIARYSVQELQVGIS
jgi:hypothetical protein